MKKLTALLLALVVLAACTAPTPEVAEKEVTVEKPVVETVVVEKEKIVEKPVVETVVVEKEKAVKEEAIKYVPRERTLVYQAAGGYGYWTDSQIHNPYASGYTHQRGGVFQLEALEYYFPQSDTYIPWLAEGHEYNDDYTELTIHLRKGAEWSDGEPFDANDVVFTINLLKKYAPALKWSAGVDAAVKEAEVVDDHTVLVKFHNPEPRFWFQYCTARTDNGIYWVPEHIYKDVEDVTAFTFYDPAKGWPVVTGPYNIVYDTPTQRFYDRRDDWWAAKTGFWDLPKVERIVIVPYTSDENTAQLSINNVTDTTSSLRPTTIVAIMEANPKIRPYTMDKPYGYVTYWPVGLGWNNSEPPFDNPDIRWAISYAIDRDKLIEVGYDGAGLPDNLPYPDFPALRPFFDSISDLLEKYSTNEYNLEKSAALMEKNGWTKDSEGFWTKDGQRFSYEIGGWAIFSDIGPVLAELLRQGGFDVQYVSPPDHADRMRTGEPGYMFINGVGGSVNADPFITLSDNFDGRKAAPTGEYEWQNYWRYRNDEFDAVLDEMLVTPPSDPKTYDQFHRAMEIWLRDLPFVPLIQWTHDIAQNTTYWTGWPTDEDPYVAGALWYWTAVRILDHLEPTMPDPREK